MKDIQTTHLNIPSAGTPWMLGHKETLLVNTITDINLLIYEE